jgi:hypothetical protein
MTMKRFWVSLTGVNIGLAIYSVATAQYGVVFVNLFAALFCCSLSLECL